MARTIAAISSAASSQLRQLDSAPLFLSSGFGSPAILAERRRRQSFPSGGAGLARQQARVDSLGLERRSPALVGRRVEQYAGIGPRGEPAVPGHFLIELPLAPAGIAERDDPFFRAAPLGDRAQHVDRARHREQLSVLAVHLEGVLPAPVDRMKDEAPARLDRAAVMDRAVRRSAGVDLELAQEPTKADARALVADADEIGRASCRGRGEIAGGG